MEYLALLALTLAGTWLALPLGRGAGMVVAGRLGQGFLIAALLAGYAASLFERHGITAYALPLLVALGIAALAALVREIRGAPPRGTREARAPFALLGLLAVLVAAHFGLAALEVRDRAPFAWDAWTNWLFRARAWFLEPGVAFSPVPASSPSENPLQVPGAHYPAAIPGLVAWLARCGGEWRVHRVLLAWPIAYVAATCAFAALADHVLRSRRVAVLAACALASTPLVATHAMLAGYADLWLMGALVVCAGAAFAWRSGARPDPRIALALLLPLLVKIEGLVWVALMIAAIGIAWRPRLVGAIVAAAVATGVAATLLWPGGIHLLGDRLVLSAELLRIPYLGETPLGVNPVLAPLARATLLGATFGVSLWAVLAAAMSWPVLRRAQLPRRGQEREAWHAVALFAAGASAFALALFTFTVAGRWAIDHTSLSRVLMQVLPAFLLVAARVFEPLDPRAAVPH
ncbi:MAG TPA: hypothetical protein VFO79_10205 [Xanthomonadales bacterium]|nr:hypothetical protein [Xanthomonadales bacterium]